MTYKTLVILRWVLIAPITILVSILFMMFTSFLMIAVVGVGLNTDIFIMAAVFVSPITTIVWLAISQNMAPFFKLQTIWVSYIIGLVVVFSLGYIITDQGKNLDIEPISFVLTSLVSGFIYCLYFQITNKPEKDKSFLFKLIDENIS